MKRKIFITVLAVILVLSAVIGGLHIKKLSSANAETPENIMERVELALGDEYKKQMETVVAGTIKYADKKGNEIKYHILKTTFYEADPSEVVGFHVDSLGVLFDPAGARACEEMMIKEWSAARYEFEGVSYLCWTDTPEVSYILEYNPEAVADSEILKMAESAEALEE